MARPSGGTCVPREPLRPKPPRLHVLSLSARHFRVEAQC